MIEIGLCTDDNYSMACGVCITSIFESNQGNKVRVHVLTDGLSEVNIRKFEMTAKRYNQCVEIHNIDANIFQNLPTTKQFKPSIYYRYLFPLILDPSIAKMLYLDCDIVVKEDLRELWNTDIKDYACAIAWDQNGDDPKHKDRINIEETYANSGVILVNLDDWRSKEIAKFCMQFNSEYPELCLMPDQDAINVVLQGQMLSLHPKYNFQQRYLLPVKKLRLDKDKLSAVVEACQNPSIIHFNGYIKPWHKECQHPMKSIFLEIKAKSEWKDIPITRLKHGIVSVGLFFRSYLIKMLRVFDIYI
ncbi:MAG: glycosyltransferase family 8 protein [Rikenellaceae bacterium]